MGNSLSVSAMAVGRASSARVDAPELTAQVNRLGAKRRAPDRGLVAASEPVG